MTGPARARDYQRPLHSPPLPQSVPLSPAGSTSGAKERERPAGIISSGPCRRRRVPTHGEPMTEILTESFCERCGTRYTFEPVKARRKPLSRIGTLGRGIRHFVSEPGSSLDEAFAVARSEQEQRSTANALEAFHRTFNFCLSCRQYTCADCWNTVEGRCLSCAPTLEAAPPATRVDTAVQLPPMDLAPVPAPTHAAPAEVPGAESGSLDLSKIRAEAKALAAADAASKASAAEATAAADWAHAQALADAHVAAEADALAAEAEAEAASLAIAEAEARARREAEEAAREAAAAAEAQARAEAEALARAEAEEAARAIAEAAAAAEAEAHAIAEAEESARADAAAQQRAREMAEAQAHAEAEALVQAAAREAVRDAAAQAEAREAARAAAEAQAIADAEDEAREAARAAAEAQAIAAAVAAAEAEAALQARAAAARPNPRSEPSQTVLAFEPGLNLDDQIAAYESKLAGTLQPPVTAPPVVEAPVAEEVVVAAPAVAPIVVEEVVAVAPVVAPIEVEEAVAEAFSAPVAATATPEPIANEPLSWPQADVAAAAFEPHWPDIPVPRQPAEHLGAGLPAEKTAPPPAAARACPSCGLSLSANARFCRRCGTPQEVANAPR